MTDIQERAVDGLEALADGEIDKVEGVLYDILDEVRDEEDTR